MQRKQNMISPRLMLTADLFLTFFKIGAFTFGGGYAMLALLDRECVERKQWLTSDELMDITVIAESTPGPIAINCATYTGYKQAGLTGALSATAGIVLPSFLLLYAISCFFDHVLLIQPIADAFRGIQIAVALLIIRAAVKMMNKMMKKSSHRHTQLLFVIVFGAVNLAASFFKLPISTIPMIIISGIAGYVLFRDSGSPKHKEES